MTKAMLNLEDHMTWPQVGSVWSHHNGNLYRVMLFTNVETANQDRYPTTIVYQNTSNQKNYSRKLVDWDRSMLQISPEDVA